MRESTGFKPKHPGLLNDAVFIAMVFAEGVPV